MIEVTARKEKNENEKQFQSQSSTSMFTHKTLALIAYYLE